MGWLSFFSRKSTADNLNGHLKAQAYNETVAANPPIRGTLPVAGNGPNILEQFQKSHPHLRGSPLDDASAPPPTVPRVLERPNTAPTHQSPEGSNRPISHSGTNKPLPQPPQKRHGPYRLPSKLSIDRNDDTANRSIYSVPSPTFVRDRNSSIFSGDSGSTRRFVDLLDAQSFIRPADFYGRVKANGTKDYGEDVADRNIIDNEPNHDDFVQIQELHAMRMALGIEVDQPRSSRKRHSMGSELRTKPTISHFQSNLPSIESEQNPQENTDQDENKSAQIARRRRSLHSYIPISDRPRSASTGKNTRGTDSIYFPSPLRERAQSVTQDDAQSDMPFDSSPEAKWQLSPRRLTRGVAYEEDSDGDIYHHSRNGSDPPLPSVTALHQPTKSSPQRRTMSNISSLISAQRPFKKESVQTFRSLGHREPADKSTLSSVEESLHRKSRGSKRFYEPTLEFHDPVYEVSSLQRLEPPKLRLTTSRSNSKVDFHSRDRNHSVVSVSGKSLKGSEIADIVPERGSSIRRWSLTSETAGSTLSSNPFRPQSGHTTNTSVDLTPRVPLPKSIDPSHAFALFDEDRTAPDIQPEIDVHDHLDHDNGFDVLAGSLINSSRQQPTDDFTIDEDASSVDSFDAPRHTAGEFEKDLLFQGYGTEGSQLPGLPGFFDTVIPKAQPTTPQRPRKSSALKSPFHLSAFSPGLDNMLPPTLGPQYSSRSLPYRSQPRSSRLRMSTFNYDDSEDDRGPGLAYESDDELNFDIPLRRSAEPRYHAHGSSRQREMGFEATMGDDAEFLDMARVAQLRREAKAKQRASSASLRKSKGKGKVNELYISGLGLDDPSNYADAES
ncbi:hypothetical protein M426DRAFT_317387 [Hypoxylon sp. CI-4A]|nr:hypothetical protein M426DRAFT_317387 [Hypoxylon sp. CI-4A]